MTADQLAKAAGVALRTVQRIEDEEKNASLSTLRDLAGVFHMEVGTLLTDNRSVARVMRVDGIDIRYLESSACPKDGLLVVYLHGLGLDQEDFSDVMDCGHRAIAPTLPGCHPENLTDEPRTLQWHIMCLSSFLDRFLVQNPTVTRIVLIGFSMGADIALRLLAERASLSERIAGLIALDCNLNRSTCFISSQLARMKDTSSTVEAITRIAGAPASDIDTCLARIQYIQQLFDKFRHNLSPLQALAADLSQTFDHDDYAMFESIYAQASAKARVKIFLSDAHCHDEFVASLRTSRDVPALRRAWQDGNIQLSTGRHHFDLLKPDFLVPQVRQFCR